MEDNMEKEKEQEIRKLISVLRRTTRMAMQASWGWSCSTQAQDHIARYSAQQYNRIFERLKELDPSIGTIFTPLAEDAPLEVVAVACRQLAAYYEEEFDRADVGEGRRHRCKDWGSFYETAYEAGPFKIFFGRGFKDLEELGKLIREYMPQWMWEELQRCESRKPSTGPQPEGEAKA
jgi:hypothetical protein